MFRLFVSALLGVLVSTAHAADPAPAAPKPASADNAGRHDADSEFDKSRPLIHPVSYDECVAKGVPVITRREIYQDGWIDLNKNGKKDPYEDPAVPIEDRITDLIGQMNVNEKTMQLVTLYGYNRVTPDYLPSTAWFKEQQKDGIGNIDQIFAGHRQEFLAGSFGLLGIVVADDDEFRHC